MTRTGAAFSHILRFVLGVLRSALLPLSVAFATMRRCAEAGAAFITWLSRKLKCLPDIAGCAWGITNKDKKDCKDGKENGNNDNKRLGAPGSLEFS